MHGKIKMFNNERGYGFILGEDGKDYFVHVSNIACAEELFRGMGVIFTPGTNNRGKVALNVSLDGSSNYKDDFIQIGENRIKIRNIKQYGFDEDFLFGVLPPGFKHHTPYLYIETYQGDYIKYYGNDQKAKCAELDALLRK